MIQFGSCIYDIIQFGPKSVHKLMNYHALKTKVKKIFEELINFYYTPLTTMSLFNNPDTRS